MKADTDRLSLREKLRRAVYWLVVLSFAAAIIYCIIRIPGAPAHESDDGGQTKADYIMTLVQAVLGLVGLFLPAMLAKRIQFYIPPGLYFTYVIFLYCSMFLGEMRQFYYTVPHWDTLLHGCSGLMLGALGFCVVSQLNQNENVRLSLSPGFEALFAFCFALSLGAIWEICEFTVDGVFGVNMQKFALQDGTLLIGRAALRDTMKDLIVDCGGAGIMSLLGYVSLRYRKGWFRDLFGGKKVPRA
ncbi:MAG: hypothetical protein VB086_05000 [Clostridiaceae bacterium]|nr:hypothetical protein [Clostridiaceae bacterium]